MGEKSGGPEVMSLRARFIVDCFTSGVACAVLGFGGFWLMSLALGGKSLELTMAWPLLLLPPIYAGVAAAFSPLRRPDRHP